MWASLHRSCQSERERRHSSLLKASAIFLGGTGFRSLTHGFRRFWVAEAMFLMPGSGPSLEPYSHFIVKTILLYRFPDTASLSTSFSHWKAVLWVPVSAPLPRSLRKCGRDVAPRSGTGFRLLPRGLRVLVMLKSVFMVPVSGTCLEFPAACLAIYENDGSVAPASVSTIILKC